MNTKKILAVSMAATTAFSMFGAAISVGAVDTTRTITSTTQITPGADAFDTGDYAVNPTLTSAAVTAPDWSLVVTDGTADVTVRDYSTKTPWYLFDYAKNNATSKTEYSTVVDAVRDQDLTAYNTALTGYYLNDGTPGALTAEDQEYDGSSSVRKGVITQFNAVKDAAKDFNPDFYTIEDLRYYNIWDTVQGGSSGAYTYKVAGTTTSTSLIGAITATTVSGANTSEMLFLIQEYNRLIKDGIVSTDTSFETQYYDALQKYDESLMESDYTTTNWLLVQSHLAGAAADASKGTEAGYKDALGKLDKIKNVKTVTPDYKSLETSLKALFKDEKIPTVPAGTLAKNITVYAGTTTNSTYLLSDYKVNGKVADEWYDFAGAGSDTSSIYYYEGAYRKAMEVYANCRISTNRQYVGQSVVDSALEGLENAISAMDPNYDAANWKITYLEEMVEKGQSVDENDYKVTTAAYKDFLKKLAAAELALEKTPINPTNAFSKAQALETAMGSVLTPSQKPVPATTKTEAKNLRKEAYNLYKNVDSKIDAQIKALREAIDLYDALGNTSKISDYTKAIEALETAIANYNQIQGWYQDGGKWFYGVDDGVKAGGWEQIGKTWFYFNTDGSAKQSEWFQIEGKWYYANSNCGLATGWAKVDGKWYYFKGDNSMKTGWEKVDGQWYYMNSSGAMVTGWAQIDGKYYYFSKASNALGQMAVNTTIDGYKIDANGVWVK